MYTIQELCSRGRKVDTSRLTLEPEKILWKQGDVKNEEQLLKQHSRQISLSAREPVTLRTNGQMAGILLDFGCEIHGGIRILTWQESTGRGARVRVRFGESVMETMSELGGEQNATNDHARRDMIVELGMMSMTPVGETGFRFVRIDLVERGELVLKSIVAELVYKDVPYRGKFCCSDELLNRIWMTGAYTVHLNMQEYLWDGIKRDRLVWVGDMHPEMMTVWSVFGADPSVAKSLDFIRKETPLPGWMNNIASYTMWYAIIVHDWYMYTGDLAWVRHQAEYLKGICRQLSENIGPDGADSIPTGRFLDWPTSDRKKATDAGMHALHFMAEKKLSVLMDALGETELAVQCRADLEQLKRYSADCEDSKQAAALQVLAGLADPQRANADLLSRGKTKGASEGMSTFMGYYILAARAAAGDYTGCLECIREYWGGMLSLGATTFWEDFDIAWLKDAAPIDRFPDEGEIDVHGTYGRYCYKGYRHSMCHGWASGPTPWMSRYILGIEVLEPGCRKLRVSPHLGDLDWVEGYWPTPYGEVYVKAMRTDGGKTAVEIRVPDGIAVETEVD